MSNVQFDDAIYILDSYGLIYRSYFAFIARPLTDSKGRNISALFGFFRNLHSVLVHYKPKKIVAALDSISKTFRHEMYPEYKATRAKTPEDLHEQIPWIEEILSALGVPAFRVEGYEADDVIATIATKACEAGGTCRILSSDKDLMQLVNDRVQVLKPDHADVWKVVGAEGVKAEWGVPPEKLLDLLSLYGDASDNVPGVKGVGVKTACKYLHEYGSLDGIYENADKIGGAIGQKIRDGKDDAFFSKKLISLCSTVPSKELENIAENVFDFAAASEKFVEYESPQLAKLYAALGGKNSVFGGASELALGVGGRGGSFGVGFGPFAGMMPSSASGKNGAGGVGGKSGAGGATADGEVPEPVPLRKNVGKYKAVASEAELTALVDKILASKKGACALDTETDSLDVNDAALVGFSLCNKSGEAFYIPVLYEGGAVRESGSLFDSFAGGGAVSVGVARNFAVGQIKRLFDKKGFVIALHNGKFDYEILRRAGLEFADGMPRAILFDTMVAAWVLEPDRLGRSPYSLGTLAQARLALIGIEFNEIVQKGKTFRDVPLAQAVDYASEDADFTWQLFNVFKDELKKEKKLLSLFEKVEMPLVPILSEMELRGIHLDTKLLAKYGKELAKEVAATEQEIYIEVGHQFNIASPKQLQEVLFAERGLKPGKKTKTGFSTDTSVLEELAAYDSVPAKILKYREMSKLHSTYVEALGRLADKSSRIHTTFLQTGTATGRLSSRDPNLQNIPIRNDAGRKIRSAFTAAKGTVLISADYSQIELVVLAHLSGDENMRKAFLEGMDIHKLTASLIYAVAENEVTADMRRTAKTINFGVIYGMSAFRLSNELGIPRARAAEFIENYFARFPSIDKFIKETVAFAEMNGYVETIMGRRRKIMNINSRNKVEKAAAERIALNTPIQGSAADIVKKAMIDVDCALRESGLSAKLLLQVHDELILECENNKSQIEKTVSLLHEKMESAVKLSVPLRVSVEHGANWGEFH